MKWKTTLGMALIGAMFAASAWAHHAAEGIISDDAWAEIDTRLEEMDSPHLDIIFEDVMASMRVDEAPEGGSMFLVSSYTFEAQYCSDFLIVFDEVLNDVTLEWMHNANGNLIGDYTNTFLPVFIPYDCDDACENDSCTFSLWEPIGSVGWSDNAEAVFEPPEAPGPGKRGN